MDEFDQPHHRDWRKAKAEFRRHCRPWFKHRFPGDWSHGMHGMPGRFMRRRFNPFLHEETDAYVLKVPLAGVKKEDIDLQKNDTFLIIRYPRHGKTRAKEFFIPRNVNREKIQAKYENGLLEIRMPKSEPDTPIEIE